VAESFVAAQHATTAQGICTQNDIGYLKASNMIDMQLGIVRLLTAETKRPMLLEVFTDGGEDARVVREYYSLPLTPPKEGELDEG
jgi:2-succinyl-5-enolpyruvyl-6-hydroxy-3-cyclohexene-1-carboxylate synthase